VGFKFEVPAIDFLSEFLFDDGVSLSLRSARDRFDFRSSLRRESIRFCFSPVRNRTRSSRVVWLNRSVSGTWEKMTALSSCSKDSAPGLASSLQTVSTWLWGRYFSPRSPTGSAGHSSRQPHAAACYQAVRLPEIELSLGILRNITCQLPDHRPSGQELIGLVNTSAFTRWDEKAGLPRDAIRSQ
jgi:hypothetical protein